MRMLAKQHIVSLFETQLSGFQEAKDFIATAKQNNSWGTGVKASRGQKNHRQSQLARLRIEESSRQGLVRYND